MGFTHSGNIGDWTYLLEAHVSHPKCVALFGDEERDACQERATSRCMDVDSPVSILITK